MIWIGTSGYNYPEWKGSFYPADLPAAKMLPYYAARFPTVEINYTFYRMPNEKLVGGLGGADAVAVQADAEGAAAHHARQPAEELRRRSSPRFCRRRRHARRQARRAAVSAAAEPEEGPRAVRRVPRRAAAEGAARRSSSATRRGSTTRCSSGCAARNLALCVADSEKMSTPVRITADYAYFRLRDEGYTPDDIARWADTIARDTAVVPRRVRLFQARRRRQGPGVRPAADGASGNRIQHPQHCSMTEPFAIATDGVRARRAVSSRAREPSRADHRRDRHRQDRHAAGAGRPLLADRRAGVSRRRQRRSVRPGGGGFGDAQAARAAEGDRASPSRPGARTRWCSGTCFGRRGFPVRATVSDLGPLLLGRLFGLNATQQGVLAIVFKVADDNGTAAARPEGSARDAAVRRRQRAGVHDAVRQRLGRVDRRDSARAARDRTAGRRSVLRRADAGRRRPAADRRDGPRHGQRPRAPTS